MSKIGLIFPGQGTQNVGMGVPLCDKYAFISEIYDRASEILGYNLLDLCKNGSMEKLTASDFCQPALFVHQYSIAKILIETKKLENIAFLGGLSIGELTALAIAEAFDFETGLKIVKKRGELIQRSCQNTKGTMVSVLGSTEEELLRICQKTGAEMSNINSIGQIVLSGSVDSIGRAIGLISQETTAKTVKLTVAGAFHSSLMKDAKDEFENYLKNVKLKNLKYPVVSNVTGDFYQNSDQVKKLLPVQIVSAVRWVDCMVAAKNSGVLQLYQCGNGKVLVNLAKRIDKDFHVEAFGDENL